jgi:hypothetical protein
MLLYQHALAIRETQLGQEHPATQAASKNDAILLQTINSDTETKS